MEQNENIDKDWEEVSDSNFWNPENEGDSIEGVIISKESKDYGLSVTIESDKKIIILPSHKVLQNKLLSCEVGNQIKIIFEKKELPKVKGHHPTMIYKVLRKKK